MMPVDTEAVGADRAAKVKRPLFLWLSAGYWIMIGLAGLAPLALVIPHVDWAEPYVVVFIGGGGLANLLALAGAVELLRCRRSAIPLLVSVCVLYTALLLLFAISPLSWGMFQFGLVAVSIGTIGYAVSLKRKGILT